MAPAGLGQRVWRESVEASRLWAEYRVGRPASNGKRTEARIRTGAIEQCTAVRGGSSTWLGCVADDNPEGDTLP
jgi:hypothetical protein